MGYQQVIFIHGKERRKTLQPRTHRKEGEPEHVVDSQSLELQDDRSEVTALHLRDSGLGQLLKVLLCRGKNKAIWGRASTPTLGTQHDSHTHCKFKLLRNQEIKSITR